MSVRIAPLLIAAVTLIGWPEPASGQDFEQRRPAEENPEPAPRSPVLTKPPALLRNVEPAYPPAALASGTAADVTLLVDIGEDGRVGHTEVTRPAGQGFDEAAAAAVSQMLFSPAEVDGKVSAIRIEYVIHFRPRVIEPPPQTALVPSAPRADPGMSDVVVRGRLREKGTRDPIPAADVVLQRSGAGDPVSEPAGVTDEEGRFEVRGPPGGGARLILSDGVHEPCIRDLSLPSRGAPPLELTCYVRMRDGGAYQTTVRAKRDGQHVTQHTLERAELTTVPGTWGDPLRVVQNLPGVARTPFGLGLLIVRGAAPQDTAVFVDGHRVPLLYHFLAGPSVITPNMIDRIDFFPGGFGVRYGRATAGILDVTTRTEMVKHVHGAADVNVLGASLYAEGQVRPGTTIGVAARRSYYDLAVGYFVPGDVSVAPVYWDYQARGDQDLGSRGRLSIIAFGSHDALKVLSSRPVEGDITLQSSIGLHRVIGTWVTSWRGFTSRLSPSFGVDYTYFGVGTIDGDATSTYLGLRQDLTRPLGERLKLSFGLDSQVRFESLLMHAPIPEERRTYGLSDPKPFVVERRLSNIGVALWAEALWDVRRNLRIVGGLRGDFFHYSGTNHVGLDPRLTARWALGARTALKAGAGIFHQAPEPALLDAQFGNPHLRLLWADQVHLGLERRLTEAISVDATVYVLRRHDVPALDPNRSPLSAPFTSSGRGRGYGLELMARHEVSKSFYGWLAYTLSRSEENQTTVGGIPTGTVSADSGSGYRPTSFDQTHNLIAVASYRFGPWEAGTRFRLVSGVPETPVQGSTYDVDFNRFSPVTGAAASGRRSTFHQLDLRVEHTWTRDLWRLGVYLDIQNVYNATNPEATVFDYRFRKSAPVRGIPFLPTLGVRGQF